MKNLKMFFGAIAFVLGISGVLASHFSPLVTAYEQIKDGATVIGCEQLSACDNTSENLCRYKIDASNFKPLFSSPVVACGPQLFHSQNSGIVNP